jgi:tetratricopeptide (TPR) repeat protein
MDPNNPVVKLCAAGMAAEAEGRKDDAKALFERAWETSRDDFEACVAAHYVARHRATPEDELEWNRLALERADRVGDERVEAFYASLYLNFAHSLEKLGRAAEACSQYARAADELERLPQGPYADLVRSGVAAGRRRTCPHRPD